TSPGHDHSSGDRMHFLEVEDKRNDIGSCTRLVPVDNPSSSGTGIRHVPKTYAHCPAHNSPRTLRSRCCTFRRGCGGWLRRTRGKLSCPNVRSPLGTYLLQLPIGAHQISKVLCPCRA